MTHEEYLQMIGANCPDKRVMYRLPDDLPSMCSLEDGIYDCKIMADSRVGVVWCVRPGLWQICLCSRMSLQVYDSVWQYKDFTTAYCAFYEWNDYLYEPEGWFRHPQSGRRRPEGDKDREYIQW